MSSDSTDLKFVTISHPDDIRRSKGVRTDIRRHVMKKIGQERRRPKKQAGGRAPSETHPSSAVQADDQNVDPSCSKTDAATVLGKPCVKMPILWDFPVEPDNRTVELIRFCIEIQTASQTSPREFPADLAIVQ